MKFKLMILALSVLALTLLVAASPAFQSVTRIPGNLFVRGLADVGTTLNVAETATVGTGLTVTSGGLTVTSGGVNVVGGSLVASGGLQLTAQTAAITDGFSITPAASYINITSTIEVTSSTTVGLVTTTATIGDLVVLRNGNASDAVHVDGTGGSIDCKANVDLAAADTLTLLFTGSVWNCLSSYDNS